VLNKKSFIIEAYLWLKNSIAGNAEKTLRTLRKFTEH
jgi:hypothetical protein